MEKYKFIKRKGFEKMEKFEARINEMATNGWRVVNFTQDHGGLVALMEKIR